MCGIVKRPTRRKDFDPNQTLFPQLMRESVIKIVGVCEDVHIPSLATSLVLHFANMTVGRQDFAMQSIPFAVYQDGKRYVTQESIRVEDAVTHLAMAGSVRHFINEELELHGLFLEMGHCCDIQLHATTRRHEAMTLSHDGNVYRADKLRELADTETAVVNVEEFLDKIKDATTRKLVVLMHELATVDVHADVA
jgi:hypothetical protein